MPFAGNTTVRGFGESDTEEGEDMVVGREKQREEEKNRESLIWKGRVGIAAYLGHGCGWVLDGEKEPAAHWHEQSLVWELLESAQVAVVP